MNKLLSYIPIALMGIALLACSEAETDTEPAEMWGKLESGPHRVGFKTLFVHDASRLAVPYSDWDGKLVPTTDSLGRQMQINIWYPARKAPGSERILFAHYVDLMGQQTDFSPLDEDKREFAAHEFMNKTNAIGGNGAFTQASLDSLKRLETNAFLDAPAADGSYPLVVFPNGSSPAFQSIMCEYLASHGFIVSAVTLKGRQAFTEEISASGIEMAVIDLNFAISKMLEIPQVNKNKIGLIGNAITASQAVAYQNRNGNVDCVVSLEGGLLSAYNQRLLNQTPFYEVQNVDVPILAIYAPHPSIDPKHIDHLKYSDRYFFHFPEMTEFHFLNFGQFERFVPNIIGSHEGDVSTGYEVGSLYVLNFLKAFLREDMESKAFLEQDIPTALKAHIDTAFVKSALPKAPGISQMKDAFNRRGFQYIDSVYTVHKKSDPAPFAKSFYADMKDWLAWKKDPSYEARYALYKLAYDSYPNSPETHYYLGYYALETKRLEEAKSHMHRALQVLKEGGDRDLTIDRVRRLEESLNVFLAEVDSLQRR